MSWITDNLALIWVAAALILGVLEVLTLDFFFVMLAAGAVAGAITAWFGGGVTMSVIVAVVVTLLLIAALRPVLLRRLAKAPLHKTGTAALIGRPGDVVETVNHNSGRVKVRGEIWTARTEDRLPLPVGSRAYVVRIDGATAVMSATCPPEAAETS